MYPRTARIPRRLTLAVGIALAMTLASLGAASLGAASPTATAPSVLAAAAPAAAAQASAAPPVDRAGAPSAVTLASGATVARVAVGFRHTCALTTGGGVQCWGANDYGQLGRGSRGAASGSPQWVSGLRAGVTQLSAGEDHTCVRLSAGGVRCWGLNAYGMIGDASTRDAPAPVTPRGLGSGVREVSAGGLQTCALRTTGAVLCWGWNGSGGIGDGTTTDRLVPTRVGGLTTALAAITTGNTYACARTTAGRVWCWGGSQWLAGTGEYFAVTQPRLIASLRGVRSMVARLDRTCALTSAGATWCWGGPRHLGDGSYYESPVPVPVETLGAGSTSQISPGHQTTCVVSAAGGVKCWGLSAPELGDLSFGTAGVLGRWQPIPIPGLAAGVVLVEDNYSHRCAVTRTKRLLCWGRNAEGQLGRAPTGGTSATPGVTDESTELARPGSAAGSAGAAPGSTQSAVPSTPTASAWRPAGYPADGSAGAVAGGVRVPRALPQTPSTGARTAVPSRELPAVAEVAVGGRHACARVSGGGLWCWGSNFDGQLGIPGEFDADRPKPVPGLSGVTDVSAGDSTTCAVVSARVWCWGRNYNHEVSPRDDAYLPAPERHPGIAETVQQVAAGRSHTCALTTGGGVWCWGSNALGGLGNGSPSDSATPVRPIGLTSGVAALSENGECALMVGGQVRCWGWVTNRQPIQRTPKVVPLPRAATAITKDNVGCAVLTGGAVHCWGENRFGWAGVGTLDTITRPRQVVGLGSGVVAVATGSGQSCAVLASGGTRCWGDNSGGIGNLATFWAAVPVPARGVGSAATSVSVGGVGCVRTASAQVWCWGWDADGLLGDGPASAPFSRVPVRAG